MGPARMLLVAALVSGAALIGSGSAGAQTILVSSSPTQGQTFTDPPRKVALTFAAGVRLPSDPITITGPGSTSWAVGPATVLGDIVTAPVQPVGPAGQYTLHYTVIANSDQSPTSGSVTFTLTQAAHGS